MIKFQNDNDKYDSNTKVSKIIGGVLSDIDITEFMETGDILIAPFDKRNLTGLGYNLTPTRFVFSTKKGTIEKIEESSREVYVMIQPNDAVLVLSRESVYISNKLMGIFHSKVGIVSLGFGHTSTTLDPMWEGPLLFALNNPTSKPIKLVLELKNADNGSIKHCSIITVVFNELRTISKEMHDNPSTRIDILQAYKKKGRKFKEIIEVCENIEELGERYKHVIGNRLIKLDLNKRNDCEAAKLLVDEFEKYNATYIDKVNQSLEEVKNKNEKLHLLIKLKRYRPTVVSVGILLVVALIIFLPISPLRINVDISIEQIFWTLSTLVGAIVANNIFFNTEK